ncbi:hypothetical protein M427DRAFT_136023 [Gonapodya prolifera JEL478]|uniref:Uncharacterized protein n=1 Tax=Gonapodya prolifera (strain JEL478) TaxID=1344416 RepID=A0A139ABR6_GONPJ|nr:hypothetical protein M427DRAFT_136023 [Gonapodya prolifera JEL478]|eukprot:KXS14168.1 hypothetical protein M427DRAFT_136023 [Gonapodya prolifera JEL478]
MREEFYDFGLEFPGEGLFDDDYRSTWGPLAPIRFGTVKPDLLKFEINETEGGKTARWWVIDAKASSKAKLSHFAQITFYRAPSAASSAPTQLLSPYLSKTRDTGCMASRRRRPNMARPPATDEHVPGLKAFPLPLVEPMITQLLFDRIPEVVLGWEESIKWQLKPSCGSCPYLDICELNTIGDQTLSSIPDLSLNDVTIFNRILKRVPATDGTEVERLSALLDEHTASTYLQMEGSTAFARVGRVLRLEPQHPGSTSFGSRRRSNPPPDTDPAALPASSHFRRRGDIHDRAEQSGHRSSRRVAGACHLERYRHLLLREHRDVVGGLVWSAHGKPSNGTNGADVTSSLDRVRRQTVRMVRHCKRGFQRRTRAADRKRQRAGRRRPCRLRAPLSRDPRGRLALARHGRSARPVGELGRHGQDEQLSAGKLGAPCGR